MMRGNCLRSLRTIRTSLGESRHCLSTSASRLQIFTIQSEEEFQSKVMGSSKPVLVDFSATWCGPCKMLTPRLDAAVTATADAVDLAIVDIDEFADLALAHDVTAVPTVVGVKNGQIVDRFVGLVDEDKLGAFITKLQS